jgi:hypothetical protein
MTPHTAIEAVTGWPRNSWIVADLLMADQAIVIDHGGMALMQ